MTNNSVPGSRPSRPSSSTAGASRVQQVSRTQEILSAQIELLYANVDISVSVTVLAATILALLQWRSIPRFVVVGWWVYMNLTAVSREALARRYKHSSPGYAEAGRWLGVYTVLIGFAGIGWGGAGILLYPPAHLTNQVFLIFVLGGMMLGAGFVLAPRPEAFLAFLIPTGLLPTIRLVVQGDEMHVAMGVLTGAFTVAIVTSTVRIYRTVERSLELRFENRDLVEDLQVAKNQTEAMNQALELRVQGRTVELRECVEQLRALAARLQSVREEERKRVAREIHDQLGQALTAIKIEFNALVLEVPVDQKRHVKRTSSILKVVDETIRCVRRISTELRPGILDDLGLVAAIEWAGQEFEARIGTKCRLDLPEGDIAIDAERATAVFRIFQETLTNVARHAEASEITVRLTEEDRNLTLEVHDNGRGVPEDKLSQGQSLGILGMRERALLLGGELMIRGAPGQGTTVRVRIPEAGSG